MSGSAANTTASLKPGVIVQASTRFISEPPREENDQETVDATTGNGKMERAKAPTVFGESNSEPYPDIAAVSSSHPRCTSPGSIPSLEVGTRTRSSTPTWSPPTPPDSIGRPQGLRRSKAMIFSWPELDSETSDGGSCASEPDRGEGESRPKVRTWSERWEAEENEPEVVLPSQKRHAARSGSEEEILDPSPKRRRPNPPAKKTATRVTPRTFRPRKAHENVLPAPPSTPQTRPLRPRKPKGP